MTPIEIRERVAREVMGLRQVERGALRVTESNPTFYVDRPVATKDGPLLVAADADGSGWLVVPAYETDIAAAWEVVEKMAERGYRVFLHWTEKNGATNDREWHCQFGIPKDEWPCAIATAEAPLAICLAAVAAMESEASDAEK